MGEGFGNSGSDPIIRNVFESFGETPQDPVETGDMLMFGLYPIVSDTSFWGQGKERRREPSILEMGNLSQNWIYMGADPDDDIIFPNFSFACIVQANAQEDQPPKEECWCVGMMDKHIAQQGLQSYKTLEECQRNCNCEDDEPPAEPKYPKKPPPPPPPPINDTCVETKAEYRLNMGCSFEVHRDWDRDYGTWQNPDPTHPNGKAWRYRLKFGGAGGHTQGQPVTWTKKSIRVCRPMGEPLEDYRNWSEGKIKARMSVNQTSWVQHSMENLLILYDVDLRFLSGPTRCNIGCIDFEDTDGTVFYDFCGGYRNTATNNIPDQSDADYGWVKIHTPWDNTIGTVGWQTGMTDVHGTPPTYGAGNFDTYKESYLVQSLFNLYPGLFPPPNLLTGYLVSWLPPLIIKPLKEIYEGDHEPPKVDFCCPTKSWVYPDDDFQGQKTGPKQDETFFLSPRLNKIFRAVNRVCHNLQFGTFNGSYRPPYQLTGGY